MYIIFIEKKICDSFVLGAGLTFEWWHSENYLITAMFKVPSHQLRDMLKTAF